MTNYRRSNIAGASYFFTVNLADRSQSLLTEHIETLRHAFKYTRERHPFTSTQLQYCPITYTPSGQCPKVIAILHCAGA